LGGDLILQSLERARELGWKRCILVGDAPYYKRFGFSRADFLQFPPPTNPARVLAIALQEDGFEGVSGLVHRAV
jgi:predicted N-acetyltransferase YhbS